MLNLFFLYFSALYFYSLYIYLFVIKKLYTYICIYLLINLTFIILNVYVTLVFVGQKSSEEATNKTSLDVCFGQLAEAGCTRCYHDFAPRCINDTISIKTVIPYAFLASMNLLLPAYLHCHPSKSLFRAQATATVIIWKRGKFSRNWAAHRGWFWNNRHPHHEEQRGMGYQSKFWRGSHQMQQSAQWTHL